MSFHTLILVGRLGRDPESRYTPSGQAVTNFSVAVNRKYTRDGESAEETIWFRVAAWGRLAETCNEYLKKGSMALIEGRLNPDKNGNPRIWERSDGVPAASYEVTASTVRFLSGTERREAGDDGEYELEEETPF